jgi:hypothetical protein
MAVPQRGHRRACPRQSRRPATRLAPAGRRGPGVPDAPPLRQCPAVPLASPARITAGARRLTLIETREMRHRPVASRLLAPRSRIGAESTGNRPASTGISTTTLSCTIRTNPASQATLSPKTAWPESLVVVQAVAGSSPVAHPPPQGPCLQAFRGELGRWHAALTPAQAACISELGPDWSQRGLACQVG